MLLLCFKIYFFKYLTCTRGRHFLSRHATSKFFQKFNSHGGRRSEKIWKERNCAKWRKDAQNNENCELRSDHFASSRSPMRNFYWIEKMFFYFLLILICHSDLKIIYKLFNRGSFFGRLLCILKLMFKAHTPMLVHLLFRSSSVKQFHLLKNSRYSEIFHTFSRMSNSG